MLRNIWKFYSRDGTDTISQDDVDALIQTCFGDPTDTSEARTHETKAADSLDINFDLVRRLLVDSASNGRITFTTVRPCLACVAPRATPLLGGSKSKSLSNLRFVGASDQCLRRI